MNLDFTKMHGLGNDFMVIDAIRQPVQLSPEQVRGLADRHFGVGFDQLLLVEVKWRSAATGRAVSCSSCTSTASPTGRGCASRP